MKKVIALVLAVTMLACGCAQANTAADTQAAAPAAPAAEEAAAPAAEEVAAPAAEEAAAPAAPAEAIVLRCHTNQTEDYVTSLGLQKFAELVKERTNGAVEVEIYYNAVLGSERSSMEQIQYGGLDLALNGSIILGEYYGAYSALVLPFLYRNRNHFWNVMDGEVGTDLRTAPELIDKGIYALCFYDNGTRNFYFRDKEVHTPEDMKGLTIRVQQSDTMIDMVKAIGANPTALDSSEIYSALQTGVVDGAENNVPFYTSQSHFEVAPYFTFDGHTRAPDVLLMSTAIMDKLDPAYVDVIKQAALESSEFQRSLWEESENESRKQCEEAGVKFIELTAEEQAAFRNAVSTVYDKYGADYADLISRIDAVED